MLAAQAELLACLKQLMPESYATETKEELAGKLGLNSLAEFLGYFAILEGGHVTFWKSVPEW